MQKKDGGATPTLTVWILMNAHRSVTDPTPRGDLCPACTRFIGPAGECPYCGQDAAPSRALRGLRLAALVLAVAGLAALVLMAQRRELPLVAIGSITPTMNHAYVRVVGNVVRAPYTVKRHGRLEYCSFLLDDGTGTLRVQTYRDAARQLAAADALPRRGARVAVTGALHVIAAEEPRLRLHAADQMQLLAGRAP